MSGARAIGGLFQGVAGLQADAAHARNAENDSKFYDAQAEYTRKIGDRKLELVKQQQADFTAGQYAKKAKAGGSFTGSFLDYVVDSKGAQAREIAAIKAETNWNVEFARNKARTSRDEAEAYRDPTRKIFSFTGTVLSGASQERFE